jgi:hypothetical protein
VASIEARARADEKGIETIATTPTSPTSATEARARPDEKGIETTTPNVVGNEM